MRIEDLISNRAEIEEKIKKTDCKRKKSISDIKQSKLSKRVEDFKRESRLQRKKRVYEDKTVEISINSNLCSRNLKDVKFSNYLKGNNGDKECVAVKKIIDLNNKKLNNDQIPFTVDEDRLNIKRRHKKIMDKMNIRIDDDVEIQKSEYKDEVCRKFGLLKDDGEAIRVYYVDKSDKHRKFEVILIDLYHLFATTLYDNYDKVKKYKYDMSNFL